MDANTQTIIMNVSTILAAVAVMFLRKWNKDTHALFGMLRKAGVIDAKPARRKSSKSRPV